MNNRLILALLAAGGLLGAAYAQNAGAPATQGRSGDWSKNVGLAVNDETRIAGLMQGLPEADRAAFAANVMAVLSSKRQVMADKTAWEKNFGAAAGALVAGAGGAKTAVLGAIATAIIADCASSETHELGKGDLLALGAMAKIVMLQLTGADRVAFARILLQAVDKQKAVDAGVHKLACSVTALALFAGAGDARKNVVAEAFAVLGMDDLGALARSFADAFGQQKNRMSNVDYLLAAQQILQAVAARVAGGPDAATRFAYAEAMFVNGAGNPEQFETLLRSKLGDLLAKLGTTTEQYASLLAAAKADALAHGALVRGVSAMLTQQIWGVIILPPGTMLAGEEGPAFVHENRPPMGYQDQTLF